MLTEIDGKWIDLGEVRSVTGNAKDCRMEFKGGGAVMCVTMSAIKVAITVNDAQAKGKARINVAGHFTDAKWGDDGNVRMSFVPSEATLARIETLRELLEAMDGDNNPNAAECWKGLRTHIKAKLIGWKNLADQEPQKPFSDRPAFSPKQLEDAKAAAQRVGFLAAASWINGVLHEAGEKLTPVQINTGLAHTLHKVLNEDDELSIKMTTGLAMMQQAAMDKPKPRTGHVIPEGGPIPTEGTPE